MNDDSMSVGNLLDRVQAGDQAAAAEVVNRFAGRLLRLARSRLDTPVRRKVDEEDVVQSVFRSFFARQMADQFEVRDAGNLWSLLAVITIRKCTNLKVYFRAQSRNLGREMCIEETPGNWQILAQEPTPAHAAALTDLVEHLLAQLPQRQRQIVALALEGNSPAEISAKINRTERSVHRNLESFREYLVRSCS